MAGMNSRDLVRVTKLDNEKYRNIVRHTRNTFASLHACLEEGVVDFAPAIKAEVLKCLNEFSSHSDTLAASLMLKNGLCLNREHHIAGNIPGVFVGDAFRFQAELFVLGIHGDLHSGIHYSKILNSTEPGLTLATSIVFSDGYEDNADYDDGNTLIYVGQGGQSPANKKQTKDQVLKDGNLALKNSMDYSIDVRVIRGLKLIYSDSNIFIYDGLYKVERCLYGPGQSGFNVYKFKLQRLPNQGAIGSMMYRAATQVREGIINLQFTHPCSDLSSGQEKLHVGFYNDVDDCVYPSTFRYLRKPLYPPETLSSSSQGGCKCIGNCSAAAGNMCSCVWMNGGELPYNNFGVLLHGKSLVIECGPHCQCPPTCWNRVSQKGLTKRLQVFRSEGMGDWMVRSLDFIPAGTFICELTGKAATLSPSEQEQYVKRMVTNSLFVDDPILVFPGKLPPRWMEWGNNIPIVLPSYTPPVSTVQPQLSRFVMDVTFSRNVGFYLGNSTAPNVFAQFVLFDHQDLELPHIMIFALQDILPLTELMLDYGYGLI